MLEKVVYLFFFCCLGQEGHITDSITFFAIKDGPSYPACTHRTPILIFLRHEEGVRKYVLDFLHIITSSENSPLHLRKARPQRKTLTVDQLLHHVQTEEINYKNVFQQPHDVPSKNELSLPYTVAVVTILRPSCRCCRNTRLLS